MTAINANNAAQQDFMPLMRELVRTYQAFTTYDLGMLRTLNSGLTPSQADVIFTLGNTEGMTCGELGERTLITKGTLTGVVDRLSARNLVMRVKDQSDARCTRIVLTTEGEQLFAEAFPAHIRNIKKRFDQMPKDEQVATTQLLRKLRHIFQQ